MTLTAQQSTQIAAKCNAIRCILGILEEANQSTDDVKHETLAGLTLLASAIGDIESQVTA